jgi:hypothetical protein
MVPSLSENLLGTEKISTFLDMLLHTDGVYNKKPVI